MNTKVVLELKSINWSLRYNYKNNKKAFLIALIASAIESNQTYNRYNGDDYYIYWIDEHQAFHIFSIEQFHLANGFPFESHKGGFRYQGKKKEHPLDHMSNNHATATMSRRSVANSAIGGGKSFQRKPHGEENYSRHPPVKIKPTNWPSTNYDDNVDPVVNRNTSLEDQSSNKGGHTYNETYVAQPAKSRKTKKQSSKKISQSTQSPLKSQSMPASTTSPEDISALGSLDSTSQTDHSNQKSTATQNKRKLYTNYVAQPAQSTRTALATWEDKAPEGEWDPTQVLNISDPENDESFEIKGKLSIFGATVRGKTHKHHAEWRDDSIAAGQTGPWSYIIACDGAGSADFSRLGSYHASQTMHKHLQKALDGKATGPVSTDQPETLKLVKTALKDGALKALDEIKQHAAQCKQNPKLFHTTLLVLVHWQHDGIDCFSILQVGDGAIFIMGEPNHSDPKVFLGNDHGSHSGETVFLTSPNVDRSLGRRIKFTTLQDHVHHTPIPLLCAAVMTDGVSDDFFPEQTKLVELFTGDSLPLMLDQNDQPQSGLFTKSNLAHLNQRGAEFVKEWLYFEKKQSFDDRSLVFLMDESLVSQFTNN